MVSLFQSYYGGYPLIIYQNVDNHNIMQGWQLMASLFQSHFRGYPHMYTFLKSIY